MQLMYIISHQTTYKTSKAANRYTANIVLELERDREKKKSRIAFKVAIVSTEQVYSIALIVSYALQEFEMLTLFLFRAISNGTKERSCQDCLTFTETLPRDSFQ